MEFTLCTIICKCTNFAIFVIQARDTLLHSLYMWTSEEIKQLVKPGADVNKANKVRSMHYNNRPDDMDHM